MVSRCQQIADIHNDVKWGDDGQIQGTAGDIRL